MASKIVDDVKVGDVLVANHTFFAVKSKESDGDTFRVGVEIRGWGPEFAETWTIPAGESVAYVEVSK